MNVKVVIRQPDIFIIKHQ